MWLSCCGPVRTLSFLEVLRVESASVVEGRKEGTTLGLSLSLSLSLVVAVRLDRPYSQIQHWETRNKGGAVTLEALTLQELYRIGGISLSRGCQGGCTLSKINQKLV